jgi:hypothetical protein
LVSEGVHGYKHLAGQLAIHITLKECTFLRFLLQNTTLQVSKTKCEKYKTVSDSENRKNI